MNDIVTDMRTLIFNGSPRRKGGTSTLIKEIVKHIPGEINIVESYRSNISPCTDCRYCWTEETCFINDGMQQVYRWIDEADNIIIASPIYFGELTGSLLALLSRLQYFWTAKNFRNVEILSKKQRKGAVILVDGGEEYINSALAMGKRLLRIMGAQYVGSVYFSGTDNLPNSGTYVPENILSDIKKLAEKLVSS